MRTRPIRVLLAEDDPISRRLLELRLAASCYELMVAKSGAEAWSILEGPEPPHLAVLDWMMPEIDGLELCRRIRLDPHLARTYVLLLTAKGRKEDVVEGLSAGADDYLTKPFHAAELRARLKGGARVLELQRTVNERVMELESALARVKTLSGLLPICSYCKRIRQDGDYWQQVEAYVCAHSDASFTHGVCPDCHTKFVVPEMEELRTAVG